MLVAHWCEAVLGTSRLLPVTCYLLPATVATVQRSTKDLKIAIAPRYWKFFRVKRMHHRGCCNLRLSPVEQAGTGSLMKMRPAEEWRSAGADLLVNTAPGCSLSAAPPKEGITRMLVQIVRFSLQLYDTWYSSTYSFMKIVREGFTVS